MKFLAALLAGVGIHAGVALLERIVPGQAGGLDPFLRLVPALVASLMATVPPHEADRFRAAAIGAVAGGLTGFMGMIVSSMIWLPGGHAFPAIVSVSGTSLLVGGAGGFLGFQRARVRIRKPLPEHREGSYPEVPPAR